MVLRLVEHRVPGIQHILGVVELTGNGVLDVVEQLQDIAAGHHAPGRHRHATGFFDDCAEFVKRLKHSIHGNTLQA